MKKILLVALVLALAASGVCWWKIQRARNPRHANVAEFESDMTEGLLRGIFQELDAGRPPVYFVAFGEARTEPSGAFIARFAGRVPPVRGFISSVSTPNGLVLETATGRAGVIIQIIRFKEFIPGEVDVLVAFPHLPPGRERFTYRVSSSGGEWTVKSRKPA